MNTIALVRKFSRDPIIAVAMGILLLFPGYALSDISLLGEPGEYFQLSDRWTNGQLNTKDGFELVQHETLSTADISTHWSAEPIGIDPWFRLKNRKTGQYLHIENRNGTVSVGSVPTGFWSSHWRTVPVGGHFRLMNRWLPNDAVHVENQDGFVQHGQVPEGYWSSQWSSKSVGFGNTGGQANEIGEWSNVANWPLTAIHAALTADGKVLTYGTNADGQQSGQFIYDVWNPKLGLGTTSHATLPNTTSTDLFCSAQVLIPDTGQMLLTGGDSRGLNSGRVNTGVTDVNILSSNGNSITSQSGMNFARWYPTVTTLPTGEILIQGGIDTLGQAVNTPEIYNPQNKTWNPLPGAANNYDWWYPRNWVAPNGKIFGLAGSSFYELDPAGAGSVRTLGAITGTNKFFTSTSVMFRPGRILHIGGGANTATSTTVNASAQVTEYDINGSTPRTIERPGLTYPRVWANSTVLPNGEVLVTGGSAAANALIGVATSVEIYNPTTNQWSVGATGQEDRLYHSTALLLPDASVLVAGGGAPGPVDSQGRSTPGNVNAEIYYPPYYFDENNNKRALSEVTTTEKKFTWNQTITVIPELSSRVSQVNLVRVGSVTHSNNMEQRFIPLSFVESGSNQLSVNTPANANVAPPGFYMLFTVDTDGVPSQATIVSISKSGTQPGTENYFQITDRWLNRELHTEQKLGLVQHAEKNEDQLSSHWYKEYLPGQSTWFRLKNRDDGSVLHIEPNNGVVAAGDVPMGYWSAHWNEQSAGSYSRLVNRWIPTHRINVEKVDGFVQHGPVPDGYWSAQWTLNPVY